MAFAFNVPYLVGHQNRFHGGSTNGRPFFPELSPPLIKALSSAIKDAPLFERFAQAGNQVIRTVHAVPLLHGTEGSKIELYLGRAGATPSHVFNRFSSHHLDKQHDGATVVARCPTDVVTRWEGAAVRILNSLRDRGKLCVANISSSGAGKLPATEESVIYLTWRVLARRQGLLPVLRTDIGPIAGEVAEKMAMGGGITEKSLVRALDPITRPIQERAELEFAPYLSRRRDN